MPMILYEFYEFDEEMGCPHVVARGRYLFENGAQSDGKHGHLPPPPPGPTLDVLLREYWTVVLAKLTDEYREQVQFVGESMNLYRQRAGRLPSERDIYEVKRLRRLRNRAEKKLKALAETDAVLARRREMEEEDDLRSIRLAKCQIAVNEAMGHGVEPSRESEDPLGVE